MCSLHFNILTGCINTIFLSVHFHDDHQFTTSGRDILLTLMFGTEKTHQRPHTSEEIMAPSPAYICKPKPVPISASVLDLYSFCRDPFPEML